MISSVYQVKLFRGMYDGTQAIAPTVTDDSSKGFYVGYRLLVKEGGLDYVCSDATVGAAVWALSTKYDERIMESLQGISGIVARYCGHLFVPGGVDAQEGSGLTYAGKVVTHAGAYDYMNKFLPGDSMIVIGSRRNDAYYEIAAVTANTIAVTLPFKADLVDTNQQVLAVVAWPHGLGQIGARMAEFDTFRRNQDTGLAGQSVGTYSMSKEGVDIFGLGYPPSVIAGIHAYKRPRVSGGLGLSLMGYSW
jgi:hypothetical protein